MSSYSGPCPYCGAAVVFRDSSTFIYHGRDFGPVWVCSRYPACDAFVGCHPGTQTPLGRLANSELRYWKKRARGARPAVAGALAAARRQKKAAHRGAAYNFLRQQMGLSAEECHIGMFSVEQCKTVVELCGPYCQKIAAGQDPGRYE